VATFTDLKGTQRRVAITFRHLARLREQNAIIVADLVNNEAAEMRALLQDPDRFAKVLHTLCAGPEETEDEFLDCLDLPTLESAAVPFMEAVLSFCRGPKAGAVVARTLAPRYADAMSKVDAVLDGLPEKLEAALAARQSTSNASAGSSPELSASTQTP
jgi:hypothetical protein